MEIRRYQIRGKGLKLEAKRTGSKDKYYRHAREELEFSEN